MLEVFLTKYPLARCAMSDGIIVYSWSSTLYIEVINHANMRIRMNACILLLKMEGERLKYGLAKASSPQGVWKSWWKNSSNFGWALGMQGAM